MGDCFFSFPLGPEDYFASYLLGFNFPRNDQASFQVGEEKNLSGERRESKGQRNLENMSARGPVPLWGGTSMMPGPCQGHFGCLGHFE